MAKTMTLPALAPVPGVRVGTVCAGVRYSGRRDLVLFELAPGATTACVFTLNAFRAAPVRVAERHLAEAAPRYLLINTGNANAGTGEQGLRDAAASCAAVARAAGVPAEAVLPFSTGVIGEPLPIARIENGVPAAIAALTEDGWGEAAAGIMTTDTVPKGACRQVEVDGRTLTITGIAKGAGMICPNMATMLGFVATDAVLAPAALQAALRSAADGSFNAISIDGDTSTNDACVLVATGASGVELLPGSAAMQAWEQALEEVCQELAQAIVRDGEGATKFITVDVRGGRDRGECRQVAYAIAHSPLVKTAFFASDPNWGRILAAIGRAGLDDLDVDAIDIHLDEVCIVRGGGRAAEYSEEQGQGVMSRADITIRVALARGDAAATIWTTDLSHDYVSINADYRS